MRISYFKKIIIIILIISIIIYIGSKNRIYATSTTLTFEEKIDIFFYYFDKYCPQEKYSLYKSILYDFSISNGFVQTLESMRYKTEIKALVLNLIAYLPAIQDTQQYLNEIIENKKPWFFEVLKAWLLSNYIIYQAKLILYKIIMKDVITRRTPLLENNVAPNNNRGFWLWLFTFIITHFFI